MKIGKRLDALTSLRFVAALAVFMQHGAPYFPGDPLDRLTRQGAIGVSFFFVLSGFVLTWSRRRVDTPFRFLRRRVARIWPAHIAAFVALVLVSIRPLQHPLHWGVGVLLSLLLLQAWVPREGVYFAGNSVTWSLSCEMFFYALFPALVRRIVDLSPRGRTRLAIGLVAAVLVIAAATPVGDHPLWTWFRYISPPVRLAEFCLGILVALWVEEDRWPRIPVWTAATLTAAAYLLAGFVPKGFTQVAVTVVPICLLIGTVAAHEAVGAAPRVLHHAWFVRLGVWSYAFYLMHQFVLTAAVTVVERRHATTTGTVVFAEAIALVLSVVAAALLHHIVEHPLERALRGPDPTPALNAQR